MTRKHVQARRKRLRELGQQFAERMCMFCKAQPSDAFWRPYCSEACQLNDEEVIKLMAARLASVEKA